jgi:hypothetical protein
LRRSKKQPEYDPNELADLIDTPAVGSGVGSHLLTSNDVPEEVTTVVTLNEGTVVASIVAPVDASEPATIVPGRKSFPAPPALPEVASVAISEPATMDSLNVSTVVEHQTSAVDTCLQETSQPATVVTSPANLLDRLWISESGEIVPESRVHRVTTARDALSNGEEALYTFLFRSRALRETADARSIQAGYDSLTKGSGLSRKTIQRTIDRLIAKHYIEIETPADIYRRTSTVYRVFGAAAVLDRLARRDCTHIAKIGPGVAFVTPLSLFGDRPDTVVSFDSSTVATPSVSTVGHSWATPGSQTK